MLMRRPSLPDLNIMANISCNTWCSTGEDALLFSNKLNSAIFILYVANVAKRPVAPWRIPVFGGIRLDTIPNVTAIPSSLLHYYANLLLSGKYPYRGLAIHPSSDSSNPDQVELTCLIIRALPFNVYIVAPR